MNIDELSPMMQKYLDAMDRTMEKNKDSKPVSEWVAKPNSPLPSMVSMSASGKEADPYTQKVDKEDEGIEIRYDKQYTNGYDVIWSPKRGVFYLYKNGDFVELYPTQY